MEERWWADVDQVPGALKRVGPDRDNRGVGVVWFSLHAIGAHNLSWLAKGTVRSNSQVERVLGDVDYGFLVNPYRLATGVSEGEASSAVDRWRAQADRGAVRLLSLLVNLKVPFPNALHRVAAVYGLDSKAVVRFAQKVKQPNLPPNVLADLADRALAEYAERYVLPDVVSAFGKGVEYEYHEINGRMVQREVARDEGGRFSSKGGGSKETVAQKSARERRDRRRTARAKRQKRLGRINQANTERVLSHQRDMRSLVDRDKARSENAAVARAAYESLKLKDVASARGVGKERAEEKVKEKEKVKHERRTRRREKVKTRTKKTTPPPSPSGVRDVSKITAADLMTYDLGRNHYSREKGTMFSAVWEDDSSFVASSFNFNEAMAKSIKQASESRAKFKGVLDMKAPFEGMVVPDSQEVSLASLSLANGVQSVDSRFGRSTPTRFEMVLTEERGTVRPDFEEVMMNRSAGDYVIPVSLDVYVDSNVSLEVNDAGWVRLDSINKAVGMIDDVYHLLVSTVWEELEVDETNVLTAFSNVTDSVINERDVNGFEIGLHTGESYSASEISQNLDIPMNTLTALIDSPTPIFKEEDDGRYVITENVASLVALRRFLNNSNIASINSNIIQEVNDVGFIANPPTEHNVLTTDDVEALEELKTVKTMVYW